MLRRLSLCCVIMLAVLCFTVNALAADRSWSATENGDWSDVNNWSGGVVPGSGDTALFANTFTSGAVVNADEGISEITGLKVDNPDNSSVRIFDGMLALDWLTLVKGRTELRGSLISGSKKILSVGEEAGEMVWLTLSGNAVFSATNDHALYVGNADNANGRVIIRDNAKLLLSTTDTDYGISLGREPGSVGSIIQEGGLVRSVGRFLPGYYGYGYYELSGGVLDLPYGAGNTRYRLCVKDDSTSLFYQRGGQLQVNTNGVLADYHFDICGGYDGTEGVYYADGGSSWFDVHIKLLSEASSSSADSYAELTVDGDAVVKSTRAVYLRSTTHLSTGTAVVNLNRGGTLCAASITRGHSGGQSYLNGDGGVLDLVRTSELTTLFGTIGSVTLYEGGLEIKHSGSSGTRITGELQNPGGWGVSGLTLSNGGSGYLAPPRVTISGGSGSNATAVAFIDHSSGVVTGVVVTCCGQGYTSSDVVTAGFNGGGGIGGSASAMLTENITGPLMLSGSQRLVMYSQPIFDGEYFAKKGLFLQSTSSDGAPNLSRVRVSGENAEFQNGSGTASGNTPAKWDLINPDATLIMGGEYGGGKIYLPCGTDGTVYQQHYSLLDVAFGRGLYYTMVNTSLNAAALIFDTARRQPGGAIRITTYTNLSVVVEGDASEIAFGSGNPVVPGAFIGITSTLCTLDNDGKIVALETYDDGFGATSNFWMMSSSAASGLAANSLRMEDAVTLTLQEPGTTVVGSGTVVARNGATRNTRITGGTLTSGNGVDLMLYDFHDNISRRNVVGGQSGLIVDSLISDNGATPIALFAYGREWDAVNMSIATGPLVELTQPTNTYSGGTVILDTALAIADDLSLGPVPAQPTNNIMTSGMAMLRAPADESVTINLHSNRNIRVCGGGLTFFGDDNTHAGRILFDVAGNISGEGVMVMNHWTGGGVRSVVKLSGDNSAFKGDLAVHGMLRLMDEKSLPTKINIDLCGRGDVNTGGGILEMTGTFDRAPGSESGEVRWGEVNDVAPGYANNNSGAFGGGFAAYGGPFTVNLGGDSRQLTMGVDGFSPARLRLQNDYATDEVTWMNPVDVTNETLLVQVAYQSTSKRALWRGAVFSSSDAGDGGFEKTGNSKLVLADGADFGPIAFVANNTVELLVTNIQTLACNMSGSNMNLVKYGSGATYLSGSNSYAIVTHVYEGALFVNGTNTAGGNFIADVGSVLGGSGAIEQQPGVSISVDGTLAPGADVASCGKLTLGSAFTPTVLNLNGTLALDIGLAANDLVTLNGDLVIDSGTAIDITALEESVWTTRRADTITVLTWTGTVTGGDLSSVSVSGLTQGWSLKVNDSAKEAYVRYAAPGTILLLR
ncbi:MAG: hypothetical protein PF904_14795 [Kiritimatiellae bacterium]|nr:hypothetical protein [Kiritimatiellia bacterium]